MKRLRISLFLLLCTVMLAGAWSGNRPWATNTGPWEYSGQKYSGISSIQSKALEDFYDATGGDSWSDNTGWDGGPASNLFGVTVTTEEVTALELPNNNLIGTPGTTLSGLSSLTTLDLGQNTGITPPDLTLNVALTSVDLEDCNFSISEVVSLLGYLDAITPALNGATLSLGGATGNANSSPEPTGVAYLISLGASNTITYSTIVKFTPSSTLHIATKDGEAMLFDSSDNYAPYAGSDSGSTGYYAVLRDSSGNYAYAYTGAIGGGETLGSELITGWTNSGANPFETLTVNANGHDIDSAINTTGSGRADCGDIVSAGSLYKAVIATTKNSGVNYTVSLGVGAGGSFSSGEALKIISATGSDTAIFTPTNFTVVGLYAGSSINFSATFTTKKYTDVPATGVHLMSAKDGTTRNLAGKDTGFNPNTVNQVEIFPDADVEYYQVSTPTDVRLITADGDATAYYAGTTLADYVGETITVFDDNGKAAVATGYAADSAEALGSELITAINARGEPYTPDTFTVNANGYDLDAWIDNDSIGLGYSNDCGFQTGYLYKVSTNTTLSVGTAFSLWTASLGGSLDVSLKNPLSGAEETYFTRTSTSSITLGLRSAGNISLSLVWSCKQVTALGITALQLRSTGTTRNWLRIDAGFNPNAVRLIKIGD